MVEAILDYSCRYYGSGDCTSGFERHIYNCGSWVGFEGNTYTTICP